MAEDKYNMRNPAVKRILQEVKEMQSNVSDDYMSLPLQENIFEWQFAIRGPPDTEFEGGVYHGRIQLPPEYPFKPPAFMLLSPNGRFETQTKICLSISQHHPEHWQPSWSVRTALVALIAFMPTKPDGALGGLDRSKDERRALAVKSRDAAPKFGSLERQQLIDEIHEHMLKKVVLPPNPEEPAPAIAAIPAIPAEENIVDVVPQEPASLCPNHSTPPEEIVGTVVTQDTDGEIEIVENVHELRVNANAGPIEVSFSAGIRVATRPQASFSNQQARDEPERGLMDRLLPSSDLVFNALAAALIAAIIAILLERLLT